MNGCLCINHTSNSTTINGRNNNNNLSSSSSNSNAIASKNQQKLHVHSAQDFCCFFLYLFQFLPSHSIVGWSVGRSVCLLLLLLRLLFPLTHTSISNSLIFIVTGNEKKIRNAQVNHTSQISIFTHHLRHLWEHSSQS